MISETFAPYLERTLEIIFLLLSIIQFFRWQQKSARQIYFESRSYMPLVWLFAASLIAIIGFRPIMDIFGDTVNYALTYTLYVDGNKDEVDFDSKDPVFSLFTFECSKIMDIHAYFLIIAAGYIGFALLGLRKMFKNSTWGAFLFFLGTFSFFTYSVNGIRNGLSCSIIIWALSFIARPKIKWQNILAYTILSLVAVNIHMSSLLPIICIVLAIFMRSTRTCIIIWGLAIIASLLGHVYFEGLFSDLGLDDRMADYLSGQDSLVEYTGKTGFRIDFIIYSLMPILLGYYVLVVEGIKNRTYSIIVNSYILANTFWILVMYAAYSNRFAYLSWFMYPIILAYPCLRMNVWGPNQGRQAGKILLANIGFTVFMTFVYYG